MPQTNAGKCFERSAVRSHHGSPGAPRGRGDDQIVRSARLSLLTHMEQELGMLRRDTDVVVEDGKRRGDRVDEVLSARSAGAPRHEDANLELGDGDGRDRYVVVIGDELLEYPC